MFATRRLAALLALPLFVAARPLSDAKPHTIDKAHSEINFVADSRMLSAHGFFGKWEADVKLDAAKWENSSVAITIDAASINTRVERRDGHLRSADFFDVEKHPNITFKSVSVKSTGANKLDITGDLTVRGTTKRITVPATMVFYEGGMGRFRGQFAINRMDYGVSYDSKLNPIQPEVQVQWDIALAEPKPAAK
ncbi:YceI family protein [Gemmatimonas sp.]|jgi:polyisoprenoid-binding protein YceI|uniref:YceI family protein n=1 Tax=Gemmatimonas sp. TaxID=1962908 RepID=UPI0022BFBFA8|nr:YceI family protein [Gemmatimonas sp.]MCZ8205171.1 YceI family protein [Gemmatimonas sp.]